MSTLSVLIVDDERLARAQLAKLVHAHEGLQLVGEAGSAEEAIERIAQLKPDVVFLDVQMPRMTGFEVIERLEFVPRIVFVTAHEEYAVRAFEVNALDFLLKPIADDRFAQTVARLVAQGTVGQPASSNDAAPSEPAPKLELTDRLFLTVERRPQFLKVSDICAITAADDYSELHTVAGRSTLVPQPLYHWETRLPPSHFVRIHRSAMVNLDCITGIDEQGGGSCVVRLTGKNDPLPMSRRFAEQLRRRFR